MGNFYHHDLFFFSNNCNSFSKRATQIKSNHGKGQIKSTQISNSKNGLFCESIQLSDSRIVDSKQIMAHLWVLVINTKLLATLECFESHCKVGLWFPINFLWVCKDAGYLYRGGYNHYKLSPSSLSTLKTVVGACWHSEIKCDSEQKSYSEVNWNETYSSNYT